MARVQHNALPDNLLHEPKGASTASEGQVYVANGSGAGEFKKLAVTSLDVTPTAVSNLTNEILGVTTDGTVENIIDTVDVNGAALTKIPDGIIQDVSYTPNVPVEIIDSINKNLAEYYRIFVNAKEINESNKKDIAELTVKLNQIITALKSFGAIA